MLLMLFMLLKLLMLLIFSLALWFVRTSWRVTHKVIYCIVVVFCGGQYFCCCCYCCCIVCFFQLRRPSQPAGGWWQCEVEVHSKRHGSLLAEQWGATMMMMLAVCLMVMLKMISIGRAMRCCHGQNDDCVSYLYFSWTTQGNYDVDEDDHKNVSHYINLKSDKFLLLMNMR